MFKHRHACIYLPNDPGEYLRMDIESIYEELQSAREKAVLVEGPNDKRALDKLGFTNVVHIEGPLYKTVENLQRENEILILTDLDSHGKRLYSYFYTELTKRGVKVDNKLRLLLFKTDLRHIEGFSNWLARAERGMERRPSSRN